MIDWRHYLEPFLDMHNSHQSFATRQRLLNYDGDASNQLIWFTAVPAPARRAFDQTPQALLVLDRWLANIADHPERGVAGNKPADAVDSCFNVDGSLRASGAGVWNGILDDGPKGQCAADFPPFCDDADRRRRADRGQRLQVPDAVRRRRDRTRAVRRVAPDRGRARPAAADLPDGGLRLHEAGRGSAAGASGRGH